MTQPVSSVTSAIHCKGQENMLRDCFPYHLNVGERLSVAGLNCGMLL